ncbi:MAG: hypothetical protein WKF87_06555 [Chryseolinea sp.]
MKDTSAKPSEHPDDFRPYEGKSVKDGVYKLGQLHKGRYGRVVIKGKNPDYELYNEMLVDYDREEFNLLFDRVKGREGSIRRFEAVVKDHYIIDVYEEAQTVSEIA